MPVQVVSSTDTPENVTASMAAIAAPVVEPKQPVATDADPALAAETTEDAGALDTETETDPAETQEETPEKKKGGFKKRIDKLNSKLSASEQEKEYWREQALRNSQKPAAAEKPVETKVTDPNRPKADQFTTHDEYIEALADWKTDQKLAKRDEETKKSQVKTAYQKQMETHAGRVTAFAEKTADFHDVLENVDHVKLSPTMQQVFIGSEDGPELMYELAKNPKELERINKLSAIDAAREIGKIEARLAKSAPAVDPKTTTTKAPKPIKPVTSAGGSGAQKTISDPDISQRDFEKLREKQAAQWRKERF